MNGIFGCTREETKEFAKAEVEKIFALLDDLNFSGKCEG